MNNRHTWLVDYIRKQATTLQPTFEQERARAKTLLDHPEWLWNALLNSMSTYGGARGYERLHDPRRGHWERLRFSALKQLPDDRSRAGLLERAYRDINPRYLAQKVRTLLEAYHRIEGMGGPERAKELALSQPSAEAKIRFLLSFYGIGPKYARNIWMDVHDADVLDHAAIDRRLKGVADLVDATLRSFRDYEAFFRSIARQLNLELWAVDRIVYRHYDAIRAGLQETHA